jgi:hypothetical protein
LNFRLLAYKFKNAIDLLVVGLMSNVTHYVYIVRKAPGKSSMKKSTSSGQSLLS